MKKSPHVPPRIYIHYSCLLGLSAMLACTVAAKPDTDTEFQQRYSGMYYEAVGTEGAGLRETHHALFEDAKSGQLFDLVWEGELVGELTSGQVVSFNATLDESDDSLLVMDAESLNVEVLAGLRNQRETETQAAGSPTDRLLIVPVRTSNQGVGLPSGCNYSRISNFLISNTAGSMKSHYA